MEAGIQTIEVNGIKLFEKAAMPNKSEYVGSLEESACFLYMTSGLNLAIEPMGLTNLHATEGLLKRCGNYVSQFVTERGSEFCEGVAIYFHPDFIKKIYGNEIPNFLHREAPSYNTKKIASNELIQRYINNLIPYFDNPELMDEELAALKIKELILLLLKSQDRTSILDFFSELFASPRKLKLKDIVENNIYNDISTEQLAFLCDMSLSTFKREFKKTFEETPATYIRQRKIEKAKGLLTSTDMRIQEVGYHSGFNELSSFSHTFQKVTSYSPSDFRMTQKNKSLN
ncbi:MAG: hypothetical protein COA58_12385 [Bacteroidetes bacterium]|nr:MAG: hypothetical protein COA58_12385 [Bacteroidota bacterium]